MENFLDKKVDPFDDKDALVNAWKWVNGRLVHGGGGKSTNLSLMKKLPGALKGKLVSPGDVT